MSWTAPANGGSPITSYTVTPFIGPTAQTADHRDRHPPATSATITGLTNGTAYTFTVTATNTMGTGPASAASNAVTRPRRRARRPTGVRPRPATRRRVGHLDRARERRQPDHQLHGDPVHRRRSADADHGHRRPAATSDHGQRADQRHRLHVHGDRHQRDRHRTRLCAVELRHPGGVRVQRVHDLGGVGRANGRSELDTGSVDARGEVHVRHERGDHRDPLLQGRGQHGHPRRRTCGPPPGPCWPRRRSPTRPPRAGSRSTSRRPVAITANTVYVASYFAPDRPLRRRQRLLRQLGRRQRALHALPDGVSGGNGVYAYGSASSVPRPTPSARPTTGSTSCSRAGPATAPAAPDRRDRDRRRRIGAGELDRARRRRQRHHQLHGHPVHRDDRPGTDHRDRHPPATSTTVTGLTNGTAYTFTVTATNTIGTGPASAASNSITPTAHRARPPTAVTATAATRRRK